NIEEIWITLAAPTNLTGSSQFPDIVLEWEVPAPTRSLTGYRIFRDGEFVGEVTELNFTEQDVPAGTYIYYVTALYGTYESAFSNEVEIIHSNATNPEIPLETIILNNFPNPFNPQNSNTKISFGLATQSMVEISIYNIKGEKVIEFVNEQFEAGYHYLGWNGRDERNNLLPSGVYLYKISAGNYSEINKMMLLR
ncbi:MAG: T9SS type A sorting domain-containing protein, partial [Candidatus Cloacimonadota bacterium]|nr:T9SS type A sorting domain-containing protein [Candidatus Cloacimonadota bacterium]